MEAGEDPETTARRELAEELGLTVGSLRHLLTYEPMIGMVRSPHHIFVARRVLQKDEPTETNEGSTFEWVALPSVHDRLAHGEIKNSGTAIALLHLVAFGVERPDRPDCGRGAHVSQVLARERTVAVEANPRAISQMANVSSNNPPGMAATSPAPATPNSSSRLPAAKHA